ncbi:hypothetical protein [Aeoliella mucimassa]|uniref:Uncharacterized protein n=1 Tax=Aeoliella mucimassa TaxID=2527972 RepID=A0A518AU95_9BACT|nr:hypothetical protein [Aeoliella mucimassa]QDU58298.1 hypothetical protein Pan181_45310 [Aeoliella mucimassa]
MSDTKLVQPEEGTEIEPPQEVLAWYEWEPDDAIGVALIGILKGGVLYACVYALFLIVMWVVNDQPNSRTELVGLVTMVIYMPVFAIAVLAVVVAPVTLVSLGIIMAIARTTSPKRRWPVVATVAGGLTGFLCTVGFLVPVNEFEFAWWCVLAIGPVCATLCGQLGAAWNTIPPANPAWSNPAPSANRGPRVRFEIRHLLIATAWVAGILGLLKLVTPAPGVVASYLTAWLFFQAITLQMVLRFVRKVRGYA